MSEKKKYNSIVIDRFGGVDHTKAFKDISSAVTIENFRILTDGSIEKRCGYKLLCSLSEPVRTIYSCYEHGEFVLYALVADRIFQIKNQGATVNHTGTIGTTSGNACFFHYRETMYLMDGKDIYEYSGGKATVVQGYVPLVAKDWPTTVPGETYEQRNIITRRARATYKIDRNSIYLCTKDDVESVEALYINGMPMTTASYRIDNDFKTINVQNLSIGDTVEIYYTYKYGYDELFKRLCSSVSTALFGGIGRNRIFLGGNNQSGTIFSSKSVSTDDILASQSHYPESGCLYFPLGYEFEAGDGVSAVQAITRLYDDLIIFTESDVWIVNPDEKYGDFATTSSANAKIGCPVANGATLSENSPISIGYDSVFAWNTTSGNKLNASNISLPVSVDLHKDFLAECGVHYDVAKNELWIYNKKYSHVWIYNTQLKVWYSFTEIYPELVFDYEGSVAFVRDGSIFIFDESRTYDYDTYLTTSPIRAVYRSNYSEFGSNEKKDLYSVSLSATAITESLAFKFETPSRLSKTYVIPPSYEIYSTTTFRYPFKRFDGASFTIISSGNERHKIHSLTLTQRKAR